MLHVVRLRPDLNGLGRKAPARVVGNRSGQHFRRGERQSRLQDQESTLTGLTMRPVETTLRPCYHSTARREQAIISKKNAIVFRRQQHVNRKRGSTNTSSGYQGEALWVPPVKYRAASLQSEIRIGRVTQLSDGQWMDDKRVRRIDIRKCRL